MTSINLIKIGSCTIFPQEYAIQFGNEDKINLQPKLIDVIVYLAKNYPGVISRNELIDHVWNKNYYVGEKSLTNAIWQLRKNLNGACGEAETIATVRKMGYRLLIEPQIICNENSPAAFHSIPIKQKSLWHYFPYLILITLSSTLGWYYGMSRDINDEPVLQTITTEPGREVLSAPSPDGRYLAYKWTNSDRNRNLYLRDLQQPDVPPKQLTFDSATVGHSVWSNSGKYLFFSRANYAEDVCHIVKMKVSTQQESKVTDCPGDHSFRYLSISPDDQTLAYRGDHDKALDSGIYLIDLVTPNAKPIRFSCEKDCGYRDRDMAFSPDGKKLLVSRRINSLSENLFLVDLKTKDAEQLTFNHENIVGFSWHPDANRIIFSAENSDVYNGYLLDIKTKKIRALNIEGFSNPVFTRHENPSLFFLQLSDKKYISILDLNDEITSSPFPVLRSGFSNHSPDFSPHSNRIAYVSNESGHYELWLSGIKGENRQKLTSLDSSVQYPRWSNDGLHIVFLAHIGNQSGNKLHVIDVLSGQLKVLATPFDNHDRPSWSFDNQSIIASVTSDGSEELFSFNVNNKQVTQLSHDGGIFGMMVSPDKMLYTKSSVKGLWQLNLREPIDSAKRVIKVIDGDKFTVQYTWGYSPQGIYFRQNIDNHQRINYYDFNKASLTPLVKLPGFSNEMFGSLALKEDTRQLIFTQRNDVQGNVKQLKDPMFY